MGQVIALDTSVFIYHLEKRAPFEAIVSKLLSSIESGDSFGVFASIGVLELLVRPKKLGQASLVREYKELIATFPHLFLINLDEAIIEKSAELRAHYGIKTPDAIHIATAIVSGANFFVTNDRRLKKVKEMKIKLLSESS